MATVDGEECNGTRFGSGIEEVVGNWRFGGRAYHRVWRKADPFPSLDISEEPRVLLCHQHLRGFTINLLEPRKDMELRPACWRRFG